MEDRWIAACVAPKRHPPRVAGGAVWHLCLDWHEF